ncbi:unnamed protein product [Boreogadus saida]
MCRAALRPSRTNRSTIFRRQPFNSENKQKTSWIFFVWKATVPQTYLERWGLLFRAQIGPRKSSPTRPEPVYVLSEPDPAWPDTLIV